MSTEPGAGQLEKRATKQEWWELQQSQLAYQKAFDGEKIVYPIISQGPKFSRDSSGSYINDKTFALPLRMELLAILNSKLIWFILFGISSPLRGGQWRLELREQYISVLPIPAIPAEHKDRLGTIADALSRAAKASFEVRTNVHHRILADLAPAERGKLSRKLENWWTLDFAAFRAEVKRTLRTEIPVKERGEWETYLGSQATEVRKLHAEIEKAERKIDAIVYRLFDLTPDEIALLEASIAGQY